MNLIWPNGAATMPRVTSPYGWRTHPVTGKRQSFHRGIDLAGWTTIVAPMAGTIIKVAYQGNGAGHYVNMRADNGDVFKFFHLASKSSLRVGSRIAQGAAIGRMGMTGSATGVHLHFETWVGGSNAIDPKVYYAQRQQAAKPKPKEGTIVRNHYAKSDKFSREGGRVLTPGNHLYLHETSKTNSQASNIIGGVGPYSISTHVYATGEPGDVLEIALVWQNQKVTPRRNSYHYVERVTVDRDGQIKANNEFKRGAGSGDMVFLNVKAADTNKKPITITLLASDAYLFGSA